MKFIQLHSNTVHLHSIKPGLRFCAGNKLEISLNALRGSTISQNQFIIIIVIIIIIRRISFPAKSLKVFATEKEIEINLQNPYSFEKYFSLFFWLKYQKPMIGDWIELILCSTRNCP